jgi:predicted flap endonuclease-1-like 5' DNA nuclease
MVALYVETLLMLVAAYFVGAALACLVRRTLSMESRRAVPAERRVDPFPEAAQRATGPDRFGHPPHVEKLRATPAAQPVAPVAPPAAAAPRPAPTQPPQDLKRIALIDAGLEAELNKRGVTHYEQIAAWLKPDVKRLSEALGLEDRINRENWIEQAQVLAKGGETLYARRRARGEAANAEPTPDEGEPRAARPTAVAAAIATATTPPPSPASPQAPPVATSPANVAERAAFAIERRPEPPAAQVAGVAGEPTAGAMPEPAVPIRPAATPTRDNLQRISGIDAEAEALLGSQGVTRYSDIAQWSPADVARLDRLVGGAGRIQRENWVEQAQILSRGGDTAFSREYDRKSQGDGAGSPPPARVADAILEAAPPPPSPPPKPDLGSLRSVRGQDRAEEPGPEAALRAATQNKIVRTPASNDLKRIRGIGVLIEKKLNSMGVASYEQIANWTAQDIDRVSQQLDFKGRIERENWVEQARILASGGATEFSRRFDGGELETSRYKT